MRPPVLLGRVGSAINLAGTALAIAATAHTWYNLTRLRRPPTDPLPVPEKVSVLLPVRNEADRVEPCLRALLRQDRIADLELLVLDDQSSDGTPGLVRRIAAESARPVTIINGTAPPPGWLGKPHACTQLAALAGGSVLVFVDADVVLAEHAVAATVSLLRSTGLDLVSPYPRQLAVNPVERLVQPLLQWSWLTTLPLALAERSARPSLSAANGQLLAVDAAAYRRAGGHSAVRNEILDDIALLRAIKRTGGRGTVADGTDIATCRMYRTWAELRDGYAKSLWAAFGSPARCAAVIGLLFSAYVMPAVAMLRGSPIGLAGYAAGVIGRVLTGRRTGARVVPDAFAQPLSISMLGFLTASSWRRRRNGALRWRDRDITSTSH